MLIVSHINLWKALHVSALYIANAFLIDPIKEGLTKRVIIETFKLKIKIKFQEGLLMKKGIMFKWVSLLFVLIFMLVTAVACGSSDTSGEDSADSTQGDQGSQGGDSAQKEDGFRIALSNSYVGNSWRAESVKIFEAYANQMKEEGIISEFYSSSAGNDPQAQINEIRNMMSEGYDAILVNAASPTALAPVLNEAADRGIVVVAYDNTVDSDRIYNVNTDQVEFGRIQAKWLMEQIGGKGNILLIKGVEGTTVSRDRNQGYQEVLKDYPDVKILQEGYGKWDDAATAVVINNMLSATKDKNIVGILNEGGGENAIVEALNKRNIDPASIPITGEMLNGFFRHMKESGVKGIAVGQPPYLSAAAIDVAIKALKGEQVEKTTLIDLPVADYTEVEKWYAPDQPDNFFVDWTNPENTYNLKIEQIIPDK